MHEEYAHALAAGGNAPAAFVTQPNWAPWTHAQAFKPWRCEPDGGNLVLADGRTPLICTSNSPQLFYYSTTLNASCPSCDLAARITTVARRQPPPHFVSVYGGLQANGGVEIKSPRNFWTLIRDTVSRLDESIVPVGAAEMARLAREAAALRKPQ